MTDDNKMRELDDSLNKLINVIRQISGRQSGRLRHRQGRISGAGGERRGRAGYGFMIPVFWLWFQGFGFWFQTFFSGSRAWFLVLVQLDDEMLKSHFPMNLVYLQQCCCHGRGRACLSVTTVATCCYWWSPCRREHFIYIIICFWFSFLFVFKIIRWVSMTVIKFPMPDWCFIIVLCVNNIIIYSKWVGALPPPPPQLMPLSSFAEAAEVNII